MSHLRMKTLMLDLIHLQKKRAVNPNPSTCVTIAVTLFIIQSCCSGVSSGSGEIRETKRTSDSQVPQGSSLLC